MINKKIINEFNQTSLWKNEVPCKYDVKSAISSWASELGALFEWTVFINLNWTEWGVRVLLTTRVTEVAGNLCRSCCCVIWS